jgi:hypothetical protein
MSGSQSLADRHEHHATARQAAFAMDADFRLITFDRGMGRWPGLALELLRPA